MRQETDESVQTNDELFEEARRQLNICNACRYCEGYCAVFPALERRTLLDKGDMIHLANLCHDCRDCYYACPYSLPHSFNLNPPKILTEIRLRTYDGEVGIYGKRVPKILQGWGGFSLAVSIALIAIVSIASLTVGIRSIWSSHPTAASPYSVLPYPTILVLALIPFLWSVLAIGLSARRYWLNIQNCDPIKLTLTAFITGIYYAVGLRYLKGGGVQCAYPTGEMSAIRRWFHALTFYGFSALIASTISAAILQDIFKVEPPYRYFSIPVVLGIIGGIIMVVGTIGLIVLKNQQDPAPTNFRMVVRDYGFLIVLCALGVTGILTLVLRSTSAFGILFVVHFSIVLVGFAIAPYTKFVHFVYRFLSIVRDNVEAELV